jgi:hypothetical protein
MYAIKKIFFLISILFSLQNFSQKNESKEDIKLTIQIKDDSNSPIPGAVILIDNIKQKRVANAAGFFKIKLDKVPKEITAYSPLIGAKTVLYNGNNSIIIKITKDTNDYTADTANEKISDPIQFRNIYDYLRGKVSGVNISTSNVIRIRGNKSWGSGDSEPLLILNGVQVDNNSFGSIVPTTIRSVKVLKGPETAVYGIRGSNGVIEVVTALD